MFYPESFDFSSVEELIVEKSVFEEAKRLTLSQDYMGALTVLHSSLISVQIESDRVEELSLLKLFGKIYFGLKDINGISRVLKYAECRNLKAKPEIFCLEVLEQLLKANWEWVISESSSKLKSTRHSVQEWTADLLFAKGFAEFQSGLIDEAISNIEISNSLFSFFGNPVEVGRTDTYLGFINLRKADFPESIRWQKRALSIYQELELASKQSMVLNNMGIVQYKMGELREAESTLKKSLKIGIEVDSKHRQLFPNIGLGNVFRMLREYEEAQKCLRRAYSLAQDLQYPREEALSLEFLGDVYLAQDQTDQAERFYSRALAIGQAIAPEGDIVMEVHRRLGEVHLFRQAFADARKHLARSLEMSRAQGDRFEEGVILRVMGDAAQQMGNIPKAKTLLEESVEILDDVGARFELSLSQLQLAGCLLAEVEQGRPSLPVTVLLNQAWGQATRALDNLMKMNVPWLVEQCQIMVKRVTRMKDEQERVQAKSGRQPGPRVAAAYQPANVIVHKSRKIKDLLQLCDILAQSDEPTLLMGETGTGKELFARRLHEMSDRAHKPLVTVNVTAMPETMFDREFFGHVKGAFSGAETDGLGYAGMADGGTLFLDEIGDLPLEIQPKLLRLLQDGTYQSLGDPQPRHSNIRLIAATNAELMEKVKAGRFRSDLYYRLRVLELQIPPLREREDDILLLVRHFLSLAAGHPVDLSDYFDRDSLDKLERYPWPGNVREVSMVARRAYYEMKAKGMVNIGLHHPSGSVWPVGTRVSTLTLEDHSNEDLSSEAAERSRILLALEENGGSRLAAAKSLEMSRSSLYRRMLKLGLMD